MHVRLADLLNRVTVDDYCKGHAEVVWLLIEVRNRAVASRTWGRHAWTENSGRHAIPGGIRAWIQ